MANCSGLPAANPQRDQTIQGVDSNESLTHPVEGILQQALTPGVRGTREIDVVGYRRHSNHYVPWSLHLLRIEGARLPVEAKMACRDVTVASQMRHNRVAGGPSKQIEVTR